MSTTSHDYMSENELRILDEIENQAMMNSNKRRRLPNSFANTNNNAQPLSVNRQLPNNNTMPELTCPVPHRYCLTAEEVDYNIGCLLAAPNQTVGFDIEWRVTYIAGEVPRKVALVQLSTPNQVYLLHIVHSGITPLLKELLCSEQITKVGVGAHGDALKICRDFGFEMKGVLDLSEYAYARLANSAHAPKKWSLSALTERLLKCRLEKSNLVRCSNWENYPLTSEQRCYAVVDAWASLRVYQELSSMPVVWHPPTAPQITSSVPLSKGERRMATCTNPHRLQPAKQTVLELHLNGKSVSEIAAIRKFQLDTAQAYLAEAILAGHSCRWDAQLLQLSDETVAAVASKAGELLGVTFNCNKDAEQHHLNNNNVSYEDEKKHKEGMEEIPLPEDILAALLDNGDGIRALKETHFHGIGFGELRLALALVGRLQGNTLPPKKVAAVE